MKKILFWISFVPIVMLLFILAIPTHCFHLVSHLANAWEKWCFPEEWA